jgi:hypothetical protein
MIMVMVNIVKMYITIRIMIIKDLFIGIGAFFIAHVLTFYQLNGQFLKSTSWFRDNTFWVAAAGIILSFFYIWGTKYAVQGMGGLLWPARFIGFGVGMVIYAVMLNYHFSEGINSKTWVSLVLALVLICIQVFWKVK